MKLEGISKNPNLVAMLGAQKKKGVKEDKAKLGIIRNGFTELQRAWLGGRNTVSEFFTIELALNRPGG